MSHDRGVFRKHQPKISVLVPKRTDMVPPTPKSEDECLEVKAENVLNLSCDHSESLSQQAPKLSLKTNLTQMHSRNMMGSRARGASVTHLATDIWRGGYDFDFTIYNDDQSKAKNVVYSKMLNKLFVDVNKLFQIRYYIKSGSNLSDFQVRAIMVYSDTASYVEPVLRCPHHQAQESQETKHKNSHVLWAQSSDAYYDEDATSKRNFVIVPLEEPHAGTNYASYFYKFTCLGSCMGGINRRSTLVVLTLEKDGEVVGRQKFYVRICCCPLRDCKQEEAKIQQSSSGEPVKKRKRKAPSSVGSESSNHSEPSGQSSPLDSGVVFSNHKTVSSSDIYYVPVFGHDNFKTLNKFAEFLDTQAGKMSNPEYVQLRERILQTYNHDKLRSLSSKDELAVKSVDSGQATFNSSIVNISSRSINSDESKRPDEEGNLLIDEGP
ncbi:hypothetical protein TCAL_01788 [Tigriopus californicus]|uniref:p53 DNA-binding domain-containing protein n=1 Tax=Tigriopus californicus TaxID=6832 RepID=A0A553N979_TIGCA|nr:cellular tumor antigen p53-like [Tigriopus californicus]TRY61980.1 hypothetical protein TCAL_01788 [Tigriopus californicus]|eukprot:TCALIF_01788-PA protein Name:"Similar to tp53 Cellular tumor antigen p53 (Xiphophorus maculatus)" AED:0.13 eAED:0.13 QI:0/-1/0/1/-1/1/1/0/435